MVADVREKNMRILFAASEAAPLVKVGGLADVVSSLPDALIGLGHDVRIAIPGYGGINLNRETATSVRDKFEVKLMDRSEAATLRETRLNGKVPLYMIENDQYFGGKEIYTPNDLERFVFFSRAIFEMLHRLDWQPEVVHCHDWHTALLAMWLKKGNYPGAVIFTIHNLAYQGLFDDGFLHRSGLEQDWESHPAGAPKPPLNFLSQGILWADLVTAVSESYAREIVTPERGEGLDPLLRFRQQDLRGITNGIDYAGYNPKTDQYLPVTFDESSLERRLENKLALQAQANLPRNADIPLIGMVQRLDEQKGFDILGEAIDTIFQQTPAQLVILGKGREHYENMLRQLAAQYPQRLGVFIDFSEALARLIYGGADMFLMPSRFEPCGLGQMIAMRYGALPIVRHTGGLIDTVPEITPDLKSGNGFVFHHYTPEALITAVKKGVEAFGHRAAWRSAMRRVMGLDFSWRASALKYDAIYRETLEKKSSEM
ncbi:MAG: glycogen synthase [Chloroflexi bacterium]|nr:glycogen synthase [Chloroflexota bacterium]